eukprot:1481585-Rhodomonas_salina.2
MIMCQHRGDAYAFCRPSRSCGDASVSVADADECPCFLGVFFHDITPAPVLSRGDSATRSRLAVLTREHCGTESRLCQD